MTTTTATTWPPPQGCTTIVVPREQCINAASYSITINAPAALVFSILRNTATYPAWNTFVPTVDITSHPSASSSSASGTTTDDAGDTEADTKAGAGTNNAILQNGTAFTFNVVMNPTKPKSITPTNLAVTDISTPTAPTEYVPADLRGADETFTSDLGTVYRISWREGSGLMSHGIRVERFHEVVVVDAGRCEVRTWENQTSVLAYAVRWLYGETIKARFKDWCEGLKRYSEEQAKDTSTASTSATT